MELTEGSFRVEPLTLLADDHYGCAPVRTTAHRGDRHLDVMNLQTARMEDGRVVEFWDTSTDTEASEAFYARRSGPPGLRRNDRDPPNDHPPRPSRRRHRSVRSPRARTRMIPPCR